MIPGLLCRYSAKADPELNAARMTNSVGHGVHVFVRVCVCVCVRAHACASGSGGLFA